MTNTPNIAALEAELAQTRAQLDRVEQERIDVMHPEDQVRYLRRELAKREAEREKQRIINEAHAIAAQHGISLHVPLLAAILALGPTDVALQALRATLQSIAPLQAPQPPAQPPAQPQQPSPADARASKIAEFRARLKALAGTGNDTPAYRSFIGDMRAAGIKWDDLG
jgi:hypothetical protein